LRRSSDRKRVPINDTVDRSEARTAYLPQAAEPVAQPEAAVAALAPQAVAAVVVVAARVPQAAVAAAPVR
jgi:hypothetical protein